MARGAAVRSSKTQCAGGPTNLIDEGLAGIISNEQNQDENVGSIERETWEDLSSA